MDTMLSKALREFTTGSLNQLIVNIGGKDSEVWEAELKKFLRKEPCWGSGSGAHESKNTDCKLLAPADPIILVVDYNQSLEQMIISGQYDKKSRDITSEKFPMFREGKVSVEIKLFHFRSEISYKDAEHLIEEAGWEVAKIEHLLALGEKYQKKKRKYLIIGLGSVCEVDGCIKVPYLKSVLSTRELGLIPYYSNFHLERRFLAVRKVSQTSVS